MKAGYRVRRACWPLDVYLKGHDIWGIDLEDLLADDWELITTGIRKHFGRHGMEYDDDTDWDNWVPPKGGWNFDDEGEL